MFDKASLKLGLDKAVLQSMSGRENANSGVREQKALEQWVSYSLNTLLSTVDFKTVSRYMSKAWL